MRSLSKSNIPSSVSEKKAALSVVQRAQVEKLLQELRGKEKEKEKEKGVEWRLVQIERKERGRMGWRREREVVAITVYFQRSLKKEETEVSDLDGVKIQESITRDSGKGMLSTSRQIPHHSRTTETAKRKSKQTSIPTTRGRDPHKPLALSAGLGISNLRSDSRSTASILGKDKQRIKVGSSAGTSDTVSSCTGNVDSEQADSVTVSSDSRFSAPRPRGRRRVPRRGVRLRHANQAAAGEAEEGGLESGGTTGELTGRGGVSDNGEKEPLSAHKRNLPLLPAEERERLADLGTYFCKPGFFVVVEDLLDANGGH